MTPGVPFQGHSQVVVATHLRHTRAPLNKGNTLRKISFRHNLLIFRRVTFSISTLQMVTMEMARKLSEKHKVQALLLPHNHLGKNIFLIYTFLR